MKLNFQIEKSDREDSPWLVLINGLFASLESWNSCLEELNTDFHILRYDCRGQGKSPKPEGPYLLSQHVQDLSELLENLSIQKVSLVGLSNGGRIALSFAKRFPSMVNAIVAADTYDEVTPLLKKKLESWKLANQLGGAFHRFDIASPWVWGESIMKENPSLLENYRTRAADMDHSVVEALIDGSLIDDLDLSKIKAPTLLLAGEEDLLTPPFMHKKMQKKLEKGEMMVIPGGHASLLEYPHSMEKTVLPFLKEHQ